MFEVQGFVLFRPFRFECLHKSGIGIPFRIDGYPVERFLRLIMKMALCVRRGDVGAFLCGFAFFKAFLVKLGSCFAVVVYFFDADEVLIA